MDCILGQKQDGDAKAAVEHGPDIEYPDGFGGGPEFDSPEFGLSGEVLFTYHD